MPNGGMPIWIVIPFLQDRTLKYPVNSKLYATTNTQIGASFPIKQAFSKNPIVNQYILFKDQRLCHQLKFQICEYISFLYLPKKNTTNHIQDTLNGFEWLHVHSIVVSVSSGHSRPCRCCPRRRPLPLGFCRVEVAPPLLSICLNHLPISEVQIPWGLKR